VDVEDTHVERLATAAQRAARTRTIEADLRRDIEVELIAFAREVGLPPEAVRAEGTGRAGRFDAVYGGVIVEFKRPGLLDLDGERRKAAAQALGYLEDDTFAARAVVVTDGRTCGFLRQDTATPDVGEQSVLPFAAAELGAIPPLRRFSWRPFDASAAHALLELIASQRALGVNAPNVIALLGTERAETLELLAALGGALARRAAGGRTAILFEQWVRTAGVSYGLDAPHSAWPRGGPGRLLGRPLGPVLSELRYAEALFVLHTYMSVVAKCIAAEFLSVQQAHPALRPTTWSSLEDASLVERFVGLERGDVAMRLGAPGLLATDLFDWYAHELVPDERLRSAARAFLRQLGGLAWAELAMTGRVRIDLMRQLYQSVVPGPLRKALGEFFTPQWLAQQVLGRALELYRDSIPDPAARPRLLDPSCGSGTFLVAWLTHLLDEIDRSGRDEDPAALAEALEQVLGIDINPVSAVMTRVNLLLTLGERARRLADVSFNVFHADAIVLPRVQVRSQLGGGGDVTIVSTAVGEFEIASWLLRRDRMSVLRECLETAVRHGATADGYAAMLAGRLPAVPPDEEQTVRETAARLFEEMCALHADERDEVWARVIEQALAPLALGRVDLVVGNPPWVSWKDLPTAWKQRSEPLWRSFGLWNTTRRQGGIPLSDVSTLLVARSLATYVGGDGVVAMLLPQSVLLADPSGAPFRRSRLRPAPDDRQGVGDLDLAYRLLAVEDFVPINPFQPDASNLTVALFLRPGVPAEFPAPIRTWRRRGRAPIAADAPWTRIEPLLEGSARELAPVDEHDVSSPWGLVPQGPALKLGPRLPDRPYAFGRGFETRGLDGCYTYRIETPAPVAGRIRVVNDPEAGDNTRGEEARAGSIEPDLLWPLVKGEDVERWRVAITDRYALVPYDVGNGAAAPIGTDACAARFPLTYAYLLPWIERMRRRSFYRREVTDRFPWALSGPIEHLTATGALVFVRYLATGGRPAAAVAEPRANRALGRTTLPYPNNKSNVYYTRSLEEAHFIAAFVNSGPAQEALARFAVATGVTPVALERLPLPRFDADDTRHCALAGLGASAHELVGLPAALAQTEAEIDELVWRIAAPA